MKIKVKKSKEKKRWISVNALQRKHVISHAVIKKLIRNGYIDKDEDYTVTYTLHTTKYLINFNSIGKIIELVRNHCDRNYRREYW